MKSDLGIIKLTQEYQWTIWAWISLGLFVSFYVKLVLTVLFLNIDDLLNTFNHSYAVWSMQGILIRVSPTIFQPFHYQFSCPWGAIPVFVAA